MAKKSVTKSVFKIGNPEFKGAKAVVKVAKIEVLKKKVLPLKTRQDRLKRQVLKDYAPDKIIFNNDMEDPFSTLKQWVKEYDFAKAKKRNDDNLSYSDLWIKNLNDIGLLDNFGSQYVFIDENAWASEIASWEEVRIDIVTIWDDENLTVEQKLEKMNEIWNDLNIV